MSKNYYEGAEKIRQERQEQIEKHGWDVVHDTGYADNELIKAALFCINSDVFEWPFYWMEEFRNKILSKTPLERKVVAGAFIAAAIDREIYLLNSDKNVQVSDTTGSKEV